MKKLMYYVYIFTFNLIIFSANAQHSQFKRMASNLATTSQDLAVPLALGGVCVCCILGILGVQFASALMIRVITFFAILMSGNFLINTIRDIVR